MLPLDAAVLEIRPDIRTPHQATLTQVRLFSFFAVGVHYYNATSGTPLDPPLQLHEQEPDYAPICTAVCYCTSRTSSTLC